MPTVRLERSGLYGAVGVVDTAQARRFSINGVLQGASLLEPSATAIDPALRAGPGPVVETRYQLGWLLAAQQHPTGRGLMLGLGGGTGVVSLLHEFPKLSLDAVDADATCVDMAREFHPLVARYEREGRLNIVTADVAEYLAASQQRYDFAIADVVVSGDEPASVFTALIEPLTQIAGEAWLHMFGSIWEPSIHEVLDGFGQTSRPATWLFSPVRLDIRLPSARDWLVTTARMEAPDPRGRVPFGGLRGPGVKTAQEGYAKLLTHAITRAEAARLRP